MLCICASPQLMHHAECRAEVAMGTIDLTYSGPKNAHSNTFMPPIDPPIAIATCRTPRSSSNNLWILCLVGLSERSILDIVTDRNERELRPISRPSIRINGHGRSTPIRRSQGIPAKNEELGCIKRPPRSNKRPPPKRSINIASPTPRGTGESNFLGTGAYQSSTSALPDRA